MLSHLVEPVEVLCGDDIVRVEVEDVEEEVPELVLLEVGEEVAARLHRAQLRHVVGEAAVHPRRCKEKQIVTRWHRPSPMQSCHFLVTFTVF